MAIILLYTTGLRRGELIRLTLADVDADQGVLFIRESKFHKSRWVPLSPSARSELRKFLDFRRRAGIESRDSAPLLFSWRGCAYTGSGIDNTLKSVLVVGGIRDSTGHRPRIHNRHTFAVAPLLRWHLKTTPTFR
jgi:integrase/recombinase XerD